MWSILQDAIAQIGTLQNIHSDVTPTEVSSVLGSPTVRPIGTIYGISLRDVLRCTKDKEKNILARKVADMTPL